MRACLAAWLLGALALSACGSSVESASERGHDLIVHFGCGACHTIGGVRGADATVGPSLENFSDHRYIAGRLPVNRENTTRWIMHPREIEPRTIMPDLGVTREEAEAITSYLFSQ
jgi:mono/diheme cytochrome c family protein